jgi:hypothetical protein
MLIVIISLYSSSDIILLSFNSGLGINFHKKYDQKYIPYYGIVFDNIEDFNNYYKFLIILRNFYNTKSSLPKVIIFRNQIQSIIKVKAVIDKIFSEDIEKHKKEI